MQIRVKNLTKGSRGIYVNGELVFVDGLGTGTFTSASDAEINAASQIDGLKVQSRSGNDGEWTDHFEEEMPEEKPWVAIATDADGSNMKPVDGAGWYVGTAVAGERPDSPKGYKWIKAGASDEVEPEKPVEETPAPVTPPPAVESEQVAEDDGKPDYAELVKGNAADVTKAITAENALDIGAAEEKREGGARKGVMKAVEEAIA